MSMIWKPEDSREPAAPTAGSKGPRYGIADTTFSTVDMGAIAAATLRGIGIAPSRIVRRTVPGFKDLAVAAKQMVERDGCSIVIACGMPGPEPIDKQCGHEASLAIGQAQLMTSTHILEVFVHMDEARTDAELIAVCENRVAEHAVNAFWLLERPEELAKRAGTGQRQGFSDLGPADPQRGQDEHLRPAATR
ncbi:MAG TPA: riboflavin synthase [Candidatus Thermoplasmatota archaeon]|nr:riboflavin synthase [Candidatus Thermoplasmatota archaeon]